MIPVYDEEGEVIAEVEYNACLDYWNGSNYTCGSTGRHLGLTQLESGEYVLIHGTQWQGERDHAEIISAEQAVREIIRSGDKNLFDSFPELAELRKTVIKQERKTGDEES